MLAVLAGVIVNVSVLEQVDDKDEEDTSASPPPHPRGQPEAGAKAMSGEGGVNSAQTPGSFAAAAAGAEQGIDLHDRTLRPEPATRDSRTGTQAAGQATGEGHREEIKRQTLECTPAGPEAAAAASRPMSQTRDVGTMPKSPDSIDCGGEGDQGARAGLLRAAWLGAHHGSPPRVKLDTDWGMPEAGATEVGCGSVTRRLASTQRHDEACRTRDAGAGDAAPARARQLFETPLSALGATRQPTVKMPPQLGGGVRRARGSAVQANPKRKAGKVLGAQGAKDSAKSGGGLKLERQETAQRSSILSWRTFLVPAVAAAVGYCVYGPRTAAACAIFPVFFVLTVAAFQDSETCVQACALGLAVGTVVGAAGTQRHGQLVLAGVALLLLVLILLAPLTTQEWASFAQLTGALAVGAIGSAAWVLPPEETVALVAILVPAYLCGLAGGVHAGMSPPSLFFPNSAALGALAVLAGAWGACHDLPMHPDLWMTGAY